MDNSKELVENTINLASELKTLVKSFGSGMTVPELHSKIEELEKQNTTLKKLLKNEREEKEKLASLLKKKKPSKPTEKEELTTVSKQKIEKIVDKMLEDENINIPYLPDFVERQLYVNVYTLLLNMLDSVADTTSIEILGHKIKMDLVHETT